MSSLKEDTPSMKTIMTEEYISLLKGRSSGIPNINKSPTTQAQPITTITTHPKSSQTPQIDKGKGIVTESVENSSKKLVTASTIIRPDPDEEVKVPYMINGKINFDVHKPFAFGEFGISELDELREIIPKKKNAVVQDLMNLLSRMYERIRKIPEELGIKSALPAPVPAPK
ncbi:hypothetical protein Tco_0550191 [Tanacetum coccineum]